MYCSSCFITKTLLSMINRKTKMFKKIFKLFFIFFICQVPFFVFAEDCDLNHNDNLDLGDAVILLQKIADNQLKPVISITGMWAFENIEDNYKKSGIAYLSNDSYGRIKGFAVFEFQTGMAKITGKMNAMTVDLCAVSNNEKITVIGEINHAGNVVSGSYVKTTTTYEVPWIGKKLNARIKKGTFDFKKSTKRLSLNLYDGTSPEYEVKRISSTELVFDSGHVWKRAAANKDSIFGLWKTTLYGGEYTMILFDDHEVVFIIRNKNDDPPTADMTGLWKVTSVFNDKTRTGRAFIHMNSTGLVTGFAELTSLPGLSTIIGKMSNLDFSLTLKSSKGLMTVDGQSDNANNNVFGIFDISGIDQNISWNGERMKVPVQVGNYLYESNDNLLIIKNKNGAMKKYQVNSITETQLKLDNSKVWTRSSGENNVIYGPWKRSISGQNQYIILFKNNKMMILVM